MGILALIILIIENQGTLFKPNRLNISPSSNTYRWFLLTVGVYYILDIL